MTHGAYAPPDVYWEAISRDHHRVYLWTFPPGKQNRKSVLLGEVRRHSPDGHARARRCWRAFPEGIPEFPELFARHYDALEYLKTRWETRTVLAERPAPSSRPPVMMPPFLGEDPWGDEEEDAASA